VVTFETNCGAVDPDAVKAFKALLAAKDAPKAALKAAPSELPRQVVQEPVRQPVDKPVEMAKPAAAPKAAPVAPVVEIKPDETKSVATKSAETKSAETKPVRHDAESSDANWISSVRDALTHAPAEPEPAAKVLPGTSTQPVETKLRPAAAPVQLPVQARVVPETPAAPPMSLAAPLAMPAAPALPEPVPVAAAPVPADHPVPPGSIPDRQPNAQAVTKPAEPNSSHSWLAKIPLVNRVVGD
jgi:hypothetical protein